MTYREYLKSHVWKSLRNKALVNSRHRCQVCNSPTNLDVHHRKYPAKFGQEPVSDLVVLCRSCHKTFHRERVLDQPVRAVRGRLRQTQRRYHYWVKGTEPGVVRALCNPGLERPAIELFVPCPENQLCKICKVHEYKIVLGPI